MSGRDNIYLWLTIILTILTFLFVGIKREGELYKPSLFVKYRPTYLLLFYAQDDKYRPLDEEEGKAFKQYVTEQRQANNPVTFSLLPFVLIQLTLSSFCLGLLKSRGKINYETWQVLTHFGICFILTSIGLSLLLKWDIGFLSMVGIYFLLNVNYWFLVLLVKRTTSIVAE